MYFDSSSNDEEVSNVVARKNKIDHCYTINAHHKASVDEDDDTLLSSYE